MFVRVKKVGMRRYVYLVEGVREGRRVRQRTLCYLGPVWRLAFGIPEETGRKIGKRLQVDWDAVNEEISRTPLTFEEISRAKRMQYAVSVTARRNKSHRQGGLPRPGEELSALARIAARKFAEMFEEVGDREYRMR